MNKLFKFIKSIFIKPTVPSNLRMVKVPALGYAWMNEDSQIHRLDGPAVIWNNGRKEWWINNHKVDRPIRIWADEMGIELHNLSEDDITMIAMRWGDYDGGDS